jgi:transcriptional regulator with XRE-family HTH domain
MPKRPYPRYRHRHNAVLLAACRDPSQTQKEIAKATGYSPSQVSRILCSPDFQQVYESLIKEVAVEARSEWLTRTTTTRREEPSFP